MIPAETRTVPVSAGRCILGESPVWSVREQWLAFVDIRAPALFRLYPATARTERAGAVLALDAGVRGRPEPAFAG